jgi:hypothetical protein
MNTHQVLKIVGVLLLGAFLAGCNTLDSMVGDALGSALVGQTSGARSTSESPSSKETSESPFGGGNGSLMMLPPGAGFQIVHAQSSIFQGFSGDTSKLEPGEGVHWHLIWSDDEGASDDAFSEHARLTKGADGSWWFLKMESDDYYVEYEYFRTPTGTVTELKYRDSETAPTRTAQVNVELGAYEDQEEYQSFYDAVEANETGEYKVRRSTERITVPAGEFDAERIDATGTDDETGEQIEITWWRVPSIPGETVRFSFRDDEGDRYDGELVEFRRDYAPRL